MGVASKKRIVRLQVRGDEGPGGAFPGVSAGADGAAGAVGPRLQARHPAPGRPHQQRGRGGVPGREGLRSKAYARV